MKYICLILLFASCTKSYDLLIQNVSVIDLESGEISVKNVYISDSLIVKVSIPTLKTDYRIQKVIDGTGHYLIPGLWDMHVHTQDISYLDLYLDFGITGVRDMGGCVNEPTDGCESLCPEILNNWREDIRKGELRGPEIYLSGPLLTGTGWPTALSVLTVNEVREAFQVQIENNVDFIKVYEQIPRESYYEISRLAKSNDIEFVGHASETMLISEISDIGQKSIEHIREPILFCFSDKDSDIEEFMLADGYTEEDRILVQPWIEDSKKVIGKFKKNSTWFTPTMAVQYARQRYGDSVWINNKIRNQLPANVTLGFENHMLEMKNNPDKKGDSLWWEAHKKLVKRFQQEGVGLLAGSDAACEGGIPGYSLHEELFLMVEEAKLTPFEALRTAALNPYIYFEFENRGKIKEGYYADLVLLKENPLVNIRNTLTISEVIKNGQL